MKRASTDAVFVAKAAIVVEEADESGFWLELLVEVELATRSKIAALLEEANELVAIFVASRKTAEARMARKKAEAASRGRSRNKPTEKPGIY